MQIIRVTYSALANLGDYSNERIGMIANLESGESPEEVIQQLKKRVTALCGPRFEKLRDQRWQLESEIDQLERKLRNYESQWNQAAEFLRAQGIKPDAPKFPQFTNLLPAIAEEQSSIVEAEYDDEDEEDDEQEPM